MRPPREGQLRHEDGHKAGHMFGRQMFKLNWHSSYEALAHLPVEGLAAVGRKAPIVAPFHDANFGALGQLVHRPLHILLPPIGSERRSTGMEGKTRWLGSERADNTNALPDNSRNIGVEDQQHGSYTCRYPRPVRKCASHEEAATVQVDPAHINSRGARYTVKQPTCYETV